MQKKQIRTKKPVKKAESYWETIRYESQMKAELVLRAMIRKWEDCERRTARFVRACFGLCEDPRTIKHEPIDQETELRISLLIHGGVATKTQLVAAVYECPLGSEMWKMGVRALCEHILNEHGLTA